MITLVMTLCLLSNPNYCVEERVRGLTPHQCLWQAQIEAAKHTKYWLKGWRCGKGEEA